MYFILLKWFSKTKGYALIHSTSNSHQMEKLKSLSQLCLLTYRWSVAPKTRGDSLIHFTGNSHRREKLKSLSQSCILTCRWSEAPVWMSRASGAATCPRWPHRGLAVFPGPPQIRLHCLLECKLTFLLYKLSIKTEDSGGWFNSMILLTSILTHRCLVTPYDNMGLGEHWLR